MACHLLFQYYSMDNNPKLFLASVITCTTWLSLHPLQTTIFHIKPRYAKCSNAFSLETMKNTLTCSLLYLEDIGQPFCKLDTVLLYTVFNYCLLDIDVYCAHCLRNRHNLKTFLHITWGRFQSFTIAYNGYLV